MTETHDQAMHYIYQQVLQRLLEHMSQAQRASVQLLIQRLLVIAGGQDCIGNLRVLALHGVDRRSAHLLACLRAAQLSIAIRHAATFRLRVLAARLPTLDDTALALHDRCFSALFLHDDPRVELLRADGGQLGPFGARQACSAEQLAAAGNAWLLFGHLAGGQPGALLGARGYLDVGASLGQVLGGQDGEQLLVSAAPLAQRHRLLAWGRRCLRHSGEVAHTVTPHSVLAAGVEQLHQMLSDPWQSPTAPMHDQPWGDTHLMTVEDLLRHPDDGGHLDRMLGREEAQAWHAQGPAGLFDPLPLAHLHGLKAQYLEQRTYREGAQAFYQRLRQPAVAWPQGRALRDEAQARLLAAYGVNEAQLVCQLFTPFDAQGHNLEAFVLRCHPGMRVALPYLHRALQGQPCPEPVSQWLVDTSGLQLAQLRALYAGTLGSQARRLYQLLGRRDLWLRPLPAGSWCSA
ncbi:MULTISPECIES: hypothetical protein [unclassified Pseudomonas]|uniref:hypothetical protein n=1 Tax=unclassified Pseudomonas TaxID=196821 RepID=UPI000C883FA7|nr:MULTISPECIES: hypothetical protein [unclassified Pseudomonas]PMZ90281.1 hypothetical protein C1X79_22005 [Pseudomonas sp. FW305-42]PNA25976.1 hypothetical protein C1X78_07495 [Pseudomonas sp. MPR-R1B]PNB27914.1 hypothetical protein C1X80_04985 [Pseudomonas sp. DP16D-E2]PNB44842.1 hypothetical protein C1X75_03370 [Pseudomonas sp. FW305-17]PNB63921.1 hypothetical protein C1X77_03710 [Pseudomonas sp. GW531-E2]